jgi:hypothetical protein
MIAHRLSSSRDLLDIYHLGQHLALERRMEAVSPVPAILRAFYRTNPYTSQWSFQAGYIICPYRGSKPQMFDYVADAMSFLDGKGAFDTPAIYSLRRLLCGPVRIGLEFWTD